MEFAALLDRLAEPRHEERRPAIGELVAHGAAAVPYVLAALMDEDSPIDWTTSSDTLRLLGEPAFDALVEAAPSASTDETRRRAHFTLSRFGPSMLDRYTGLLRHPNPRVREDAATGVHFCYGEGLPAAPHLVPLMADPDPEVARRAAWVLSMMGEPVIPLLQRVRREGPGRVRARALDVLAAVGGEDALSGGDRRAVERLIRIKLLDERPEPIDQCVLSWIAVPGGDQRGLADELGLTGPRRVTLRMGLSAIDDDAHSLDYRRVFLMPQLDGWTLLLGPWCNPADPERGQAVMTACERLSARYGRAQAFFVGEYGMGAFLVAEAGRVLRRRVDTQSPEEDEPLTLGRPLPVEHDLLDDPGEDTGIGESVPDLAAALSLNPLTLTADTPITGAGLLAHTPEAHGQKVPLRSLRI